MELNIKAKKKEIIDAIASPSGNHQAITPTDSDTLAQQQAQSAMQVTGAYLTLTGQPQVVVSSSNKAV